MVMESHGKVMEFNLWISVGTLFEFVSGLHAARVNVFFIVSHRGQPPLGKLLESLLEVFTALLLVVRMIVPLDE